MFQSVIRPTRFEPGMAIALFLLLISCPLHAQETVPQLVVLPFAEQDDGGNFSGIANAISFGIQQKTQVWGITSMPIQEVYRLGFISTDGEIAALSKRNIDAIQAFGNYQYCLTGFLRARSEESAEVTIVLHGLPSGETLQVESYDLILDSTIFNVIPEISRDIVERLGRSVPSNTGTALEDNFSDEKIMALVGRALEAVRLGLTDVAISGAEEVLRLIPNHPIGLYIRGYAYVNQRLDRQGLNDLTRSIEECPELVDAYVSLATAQSLLERDELAALRTMEDALRLNPKHTYLLGATAISLYKLGQLKKGDAALAALTEANSETDMVAFLVAYSLVKKHAPFEERLIAAEKAYEVQPRHPLPLALLGLTRVEKFGFYSKLDDDFRTGVGLLEEAEKQLKHMYPSDRATLLGIWNSLSMAHGIYLERALSRGDEEAVHRSLIEVFRYGSRQAQNVDIDLSIENSPHRIIAQIYASGKIDDSWERALRVARNRFSIRPLDEYARVLESLSR